MKSASSKLSRRQFLRITASAGLLTAGSIGIAMRGAQTPVSVKESRLLMGSIANLTLISTDSQQAQAAIDAAFGHMQALEDIFSRFREHSQLSALNAEGSLSDPHPALVEVLQRAAAYGHLTNGAFDITIEPVHKLYRDQARIGKLPSGSAIAAAREQVNYQNIEISQSRIAFSHMGMGITLDGIAKGYIIDQGSEILRQYGFGSVLVEIGGDMNALGHPAARPWQISIQQPPDVPPEQQPLVAQLSNSALATSGDYLNTFTPDNSLNHILDPQSGISPLELASASVVASSACDADALATALIVMGKERGLALADRLPNVEALVITKTGSIHQTTGFPINAV